MWKFLFPVFSVIKIPAVNAQLAKAQISSRSKVQAGRDVALAGQACGTEIHRRITGEIVNHIL